MFILALTVSNSARHKLNKMESKIPTSEGQQTIPEIMDHLAWCAYKANRGYGCSHEGLVRIGLGNEAMRQRYEREIENQINPSLN